MEVKKININQSELTYNIASDIYDVTSNNNDATFSSLSELLSAENLSTLIPTAIRCGGMSIRFIQSSDNKYVQYRLMSNTWSTSVVDWRGVDDEPTFGSDNLVKSGGVFSSISAESARATTAEEANAQAIISNFEESLLSIINPTTIHNGGYYIKNGNLIDGNLASIGGEYDLSDKIGKKYSFFLKPKVQHLL